MVEVTDVTIVAGVPTAGDGTVPTLAKTNTILTNLSRGVGPGDSNTQRITIDANQLGALGPAAMAASVPVTIATNQTAIPAIAGGSQYQTVAVSQTDRILGATGAVGDYLECLICVVATAATSQVQIKDGNGSAMIILPNAVGAGVGTYTIPIGLISRNATTPGWKVTTAAGVTVIGTGKFT
jgi:hypothetical protein